MIDFALTTPIDDVEIHHFPIEIISEILQQVNSQSPFVSRISLRVCLSFLARVQSSTICS